MNKVFIKNVLVIVLGIIVITMSIGYTNITFSHSDKESEVLVNNLDVCISNINVFTYQIDNKDIYYPTIVDGKTSLTFGVNFNNINEYIFTFDIENRSNINATLSSFNLSIKQDDLETTVNNSNTIIDKVNNIRYIVTYLDDTSLNIHDKLDSNTKRTIKVKVINNNSSNTYYTFNLKLNYK